MTDQHLSAALLAVTLVSASLASACSGDATRPLDADTVAQSAQPATPVQASTELSPVAAPFATSGAKPAEPVVQSPGKGGAPVELAWSIDGKAQIGVPLGIDLDLRPTADVSDVFVQVSAGRGLEPMSGHGDVPLTRLSRNGGFEHRVVVTPLDQGLSYVHVVAMVQTPDGRQMRSFAVPVTTGEGAGAVKPKSAGQVQIDANGVRVRVMPAQEDAGG